MSYARQNILVKEVSWILCEVVGQADIMLPSRHFSDACLPAGCVDFEEEGVDQTGYSEDAADDGAEGSEEGEEGHAMLWEGDTYGGEIKGDMEARRFSFSEDEIFEEFSDRELVGVEWRWVEWFDCGGNNFGEVVEWAESRWRRYAER